MERIYTFLHSFTRALPVAVPSSTRVVSHTVVRSKSSLVHACLFIFDSCLVERVYELCRANTRALPVAVPSSARVVRIVVCSSVASTRPSVYIY